MYTRVAESLGMTNFQASAWEATEEEGGGKFQRVVKYELNRQTCAFGSTVTAIQQRWSSEDVALIEEVITLHDVPFGDSFQVSGVCIEAGIGTGDGA